MLTDDQPGHRLEHLAGAHDRTILELTCRYRPFARSVGDADQILFGVVDIGEIGERAAARDGHVCTQGQLQHDVERDRLLRVRTHAVPHERSEIEQAERNVELACLHGIELIPPCAVCLCHRRDAGILPAQLDGDAGERSAGGVSGGANDATVRRELRENRGRGSECQEQEHGGDPDSFHRAYHRIRIAVERPAGRSVGRLPL